MKLIVNLKKKLNINKLFNKKYLLIIGFILIMLFSVACNPKPPSNENLDSLANCLTEKGAVMYGTESCSYCQSQKKMFGNSFKYINSVDCDRNKNECIKNGVTGYPTWKINNSNYPGQQDLYRLAELSGCLK